MKKQKKFRGWMDKDEWADMGYGDKRNFATTAPKTLHIPEIHKTKNKCLEHDGRFEEPTPIKVEIIAKIIQ
jgi:hypothetical protein